MATKKPDPDRVKGVPGVKGRGLGCVGSGGGGGGQTWGRGRTKFFSAGASTEGRAIGKDSRLEAAGNCRRQTEMTAKSATEKAETHTCAGPR